MQIVTISPEYFKQYKEFYEREKGGVRTHHSTEALQWSFLNFPMARDNEPIMELALDNGRVIGCLGALPHWLLNDNRAIRACVIIDWLVDSQFRGRKVGLALIQRVLEQYPVVIGLGTNQTTSKLLRSLGLADYGKNSTFRSILNVVKIMKQV